MVSMIWGRLGRFRQHPTDPKQPNYLKKINSES
jgi:hypothetical protein